MANKVLVEFDGDNAKLKKSSKDSKESIKGVGDESKKTDEQIKKTGDSGNQAGEKIGRGFKVASIAVAAATVAASAAVIKLTTDSIKAYAEFEQLSGGVDKLFGSASDAVMANAKDAYKTAGLSANAYMETVTGISASLISGLGGNTQKAAELADVAIRDMSDNANTYGTDMESIQRTYQGFAKGQFAMLDNLKLGYGGSASEMARLVNNSGVVEGSMVTAANVSEVSMDKIIEAIHKTQQNMGIMGTTANEAASTISGSLASAKASWTNVLASFASGDNNAIEEALNGFLESAGNFVKNISKILPNVLNGVIQLIDKIIPQIPPLLAKLLPVLIEGVISVIEGLVDAIPDLLKVLTKIIPKLVKGLVKIFTAILDAAPEIIDGFIKLFQALGKALTDPKMLTKIIQSLSKAIVAIVDAMAKMMEDPKQMQLMINAVIVLFTEIVKALPLIIGAFAQMTPAIIKALVAFLTEPENLKILFGAMLTLGWELIKAIPLIIWEVLKAWGTLLPGIAAFFVMVGGKIKDIWNGLVGWFKGVPGKIVDAFGSIKDGIGNLFKLAIDNIKKSFKAGMNWVIDIVNKVIRGVNKVAGKIPGIGNKLKIDEIEGFARGGLVGMADGGKVSGRGTGTSDSVPAMLSNGEFVLRAAAVRDIGVDNLTSMNEGEKPKANGPIVGEMHVYEGADAMALAQQIGALVRFA